MNWFTHTGYGPDTIEFTIDDTRYFVIPGSHGEPEEFCRSRHGAGLAVFDSQKEFNSVTKQLKNLIAAGVLEGSGHTFWLGGRTDQNTTITDFGDISIDGIVTLFYYYQHNSKSR